MEVLAREVAQAHLGACVEYHDDGSQNGMPDARITYPDGRLGWLEVVRDTSGDYEAQQKALTGGEVLSVKGLQWAWLVHLRHDMSLNSLKKHPGWLVSELQRAGAESRGDAERAKYLVGCCEQAKAIERAGRGGSKSEKRDITYSIPLLGRRPGDVTIRSAFFSHAHSTSELSGWVRDFFDRHHDVAKKMSADVREEQHAFVWVGLDSGPEQAYIIAQRGLTFHHPPEDPPLPAGITHLWIAGIGSADRAVAWFPDRGWHDVADHWTETPTGAEVVRRHQEDG